MRRPAVGLKRASLLKAIKRLDAFARNIRARHRHTPTDVRLPPSGFAAQADRSAPVLVAPADSPRTREALPLAICARIFELLANDRAALAACSLTCHAWLAPAHHFLFRDLEIVGTAVPDLLALVSGYLPSADALPAHVRSLTIFGSPEMDDFDAVSVLDFHRLLRALDRLESLTLRGWGMSPDPLAGAEERASEFIALADQCGAPLLIPHVRRLTLQSAVIFDYELALFPNLVELHAQEPYLLHVSLPRPCSDMPRARILELSWTTATKKHADDSWWWAEDAPVDLTHLRTLNLGYNVFDHAEVQALLDKNVGSMERLTFSADREDVAYHQDNYPPEANVSELALDLSMSKCLQSVHFKDVLLDPSPCTGAICALLEQLCMDCSNNDRKPLNSHPQLRLVILDLPMGYQHSPQNFPIAMGEMSGPEWTRVASCLDRLRMNIPQLTVRSM